MNEATAQADTTAKDTETAKAGNRSGLASGTVADTETAPPDYLITGPEIVVTARKRDELLKDVPFTIAVIDDAVIAKEGLRTVEELSRRVPGLTFDQGGFLADTRPAIRGMQFERGRPSVAILLDGLELSGENMVFSGGFSSLRRQKPTYRNRPLIGPKQHPKATQPPTKRTGLSVGKMLGRTPRRFHFKAAEN